MKSDFPVWRKVTLGRHKSVKDLQDAILAKDCWINYWTKDIMANPAFTLAKEERTLNLVTLTVKELGLQNGATTAEIFQAAKERGLELCPAEVGPALREQYADQPADEYITVAMEPIASSGGDLDLFNVNHEEDVRWLFTSYGHPDLWWDDGSQFVFVSGK